MSAEALTLARREAEAARLRLVSTATQLQQRLKPGTIASNAWAGVKDKGGEIAEGAAEAVKSRPVPVAAVLAAFTLFLARAPIRSAVSKIFSHSDEDDDLVVARLDGGDKNYDLTAPAARRKSKKGAKA